MRKRTNLIPNLKLFCKYYSGNKVKLFLGNLFWRLLEGLFRHHFLFLKLLQIFALGAYYS